MPRGGVVRLPSEIVIVKGRKLADHAAADRLRGAVDRRLLVGDQCDL
jgi:hypothetical protein